MPGFSPGARMYVGVGRLSATIGLMPRMFGTSYITRVGRVNRST